MIKLNTVGKPLFTTITPSYTFNESEPCGGKIGCYSFLCLCTLFPLKLKIMMTRLEKKLKS